MYKNIVEKQEIVEKNYKMMQLYAPNISALSAQHIRRMLNNPALNFNKSGVRAMMIEDGFGVVNFVDLYASMNKIVADWKR